MICSIKFYYLTDLQVYILPEPWHAPESMNLHIGLITCTIPEAYVSIQGIGDRAANADTPVYIRSEYYARNQCRTEDGSYIMHAYLIQHRMSGKIWIEFPLIQGSGNVAGNLKEDEDGHPVFYPRWWIRANWNRKRILAYAKEVIERRRREKEATS
jgi:hypothetical protein